MNLRGHDSLPFKPQPTTDEAKWLCRLVQKVIPSQHLVTWGGQRDDDEEVAYCERDGTWVAGRYIGVVSFEGRSLTIEPRFGIDTIARWLGQCLNLAVVDCPGRFRKDVPFVAQLLALVWSRAFTEASRHGLPALYHEKRNISPIVRGRLDVQRTIADPAFARESLVSIQRERSLDNPVSKIIVAAYATLHRWMGSGVDASWLSDEARDLLLRLAAVTGSKPRLPSDAELSRVRYTPITARFANVAALSKQIIQRRGLMSDYAPRGQVQGVLLDVAEIWELFVLAVTKRAFANRLVSHGSREKHGRMMLLRSKADGRPLAELRPDALVCSHNAVEGIIDAKYKSLRPTRLHPSGVQLADLYQLTTYLTANPDDTRPVWGLLAYPEDICHGELPPAERGNPWILGKNGRSVFLTTLPHNIPAAAAKLGSVVAAVCRS
jgi:5-methylcytosine-specific restriction enzyme subunit McrC